MIDSFSQHRLREFFQSVAKAHQSALLMDYDGTLAAFQPMTREAHPYPGVPELVERIMKTGRTRVVLISGRRAHEVISLLDISPPPEVWGTHGLEHLRADGSYQMQSIDSYTAEALTAADQWVDGLNLHHLAEHKPGSLAVHWRGLSDDEAHEIRAKVTLGWLTIADRGCLTLEQFDGGIEIRMNNRNKGDAVRAVLAEINAGDPVAYLGDDESDEAAFRALRGRGLSVLVRPQWRDTAANLWIRPPAQLLSFLEDWLKACRHGPDHDSESTQVGRDLIELLDGLGNGRDSSSH